MLRRCEVRREHEERKEGGREPVDRALSSTPVDARRGRAGGDRQVGVCVLAYVLLLVLLTSRLVRHSHMMSSSGRFTSTPGRCVLTDVSFSISLSTSTSPGIIARDIRLRRCLGGGGGTAGRDDYEGTQWRGRSALVRWSAGARCAHCQRGRHRKPESPPPTAPDRARNPTEHGNGTAGRGTEGHEDGQRMRTGEPTSNDGGTGAQLCALSAGTAQPTAPDRATEPNGTRQRNESIIQRNSTVQQRNNEEGQRNNGGRPATSDEPTSNDGGMGALPRC